jgi:predicted transposase/invertase (TIGR01784 family)
MAENIYDKGYRSLLADKGNFLDLLRNQVKLPWTRLLREENLELVNTDFIMKSSLDREADIIYKAKIGVAEIIFYMLFELQSYVDFTMPFRTLEYMVENLRREFLSTPAKERERKPFRLPAVVPIVFYNGKENWTCVRSFKEYFADYELFMPNLIDFEYILIDLNRTDEKEQRENPTLMNLVMYADRAADLETSIKKLYRTSILGKKNLPQEKQVQLKDFIYNVELKKLHGILNEDGIQELKDTFEKEDENQMTYATERAVEEFKQKYMLEGKREGKREGMREGMLEGMREGLLEGRREVAVKLLREGMSPDTIVRVTGLSLDTVTKLANE